jgi:aerotaxis receptor
MRKNLPVTDNEVKLDESSCILSTTNLKGQITYVNRDFIEISGFTEEELLGQPHNMVRHPDMPPAAFEDMWNHLKAGKTWMGLVKNRCKNGDYYWVNAFATPILEHGEIKEYQSVRVKASPDEVARAEKLYAKMNAGHSLRAYSHPLRLNWKLLATIGLSFIPILAAIVAGATTSTALLAVGTSLALALGATAIIMRPVCRSLEKARAIAHNPLMQYVFTGERSEAGQIMFGLHKACGELKAVVGRLTDSSQQLYTMAQSLDADIGLTQQGVNHQNEQTTAAATAVNELSASATQVAQNASEAAQATDTARQETTNSNQVVSETKDLMNQLAQEVEASSSVINQLKEDSTEIGAVLDVISGIAEQTNLLALNAAIEAARAGEQGRGFAVVADEVRTLASRTAESTQEIKTIIDKLQAGANNAVDAMDGSHSLAQQGVEQADMAVQSLQSITDAVETINAMNLQIATAAEEQSRVSEDINSQVDSIQEVNEVTVTSMTSTQNNSTELGQLALNLRQLAQQFWNRKT